MKNRIILVCTLIFACNGILKAGELDSRQQLGSAIFFDRSLSLKGNQGCVSCHAPGTGWTGDIAKFNAHGAVYDGSVKLRFGNRKPPSAAYATNSPVLHYDKKEGLFIGGNFWNGRATGEKLGNPAADQALAPFVNPVEHALPESACVVYKVCHASYPVKLESVWPEACDIDWPADVKTACHTEGAVVKLPASQRTKVDKAYGYIGLAIAAFEASSVVNSFTSKYDYYLGGRAQLTKQELHGMKLFRGKGKCADCHPMDRGDNGEPPLFTDYSYDNLGTPRNPENPWYTMPKTLNPEGRMWVDKGLGGFLQTRPDYQRYAQENYGKQKVPTVRNVDKRSSPDFVKAYMHNGYFKTLKGLVHFYNTRDIKPACKDPFTTEAEALAQQCWPVAEVTDNVNKEELGDLNLTDEEENAVVAFMKTLSDGYVPP